MPFISASPIAMMESENSFVLHNGDYEDNESHVATDFSTVQQFRQFESIFNIFHIHVLDWALFTMVITLRQICAS